MKALVKRLLQTGVDLTILSAALWLAFLIRFEGSIEANFKGLLMAFWPYLVFCQYVLLVIFDVPNFSWRFLGLRETARIMGAMALSLGALVLLRFYFAPVFSYGHLPLGVAVLDVGLGFMGLVGVRVLVRLFFEKTARQRRADDAPQAEPAFLVGAGNAGLTVAKEIKNRPDLGLRPVGFLDDDPLKRGRLVHGIRVLGAVKDVGVLAKKHGVKQALITIANASGGAIRQISTACEAAGVSTKVIPGLYEIVGGQVRLSRIRNVTIEDLLGRDPVTLEETAINEVICGRIVMVTGAGGSIGSELCRQICRFRPAKLLLVERAENNLFFIHKDLGENFSDIKTVPCLADIGDAARMESLLREHAPEVIFHAAAHKHVPMMEWNPGEAVKNNIFGTRVLADLAAAAGVGEFVMISTDKAVNPSSVMGVCKRTAEIYVQALSRRSKTRFLTVRFGNVLGSSGSVVPIFREQIARGGPVTVTHPEMKRYFMIIPEACRLVLQAAAMGKGGEIFVLDMGEPVKIVDLAREMIRLSGFKPDEDVAIKFTGTRPGEKLFEELVLDKEKADKTRHPNIFVLSPQTHEWENILRQFTELSALLRELEQNQEPVGNYAARIQAKLAELVPEYRPGQ